MAEKFSIGDVQVSASALKTAYANSVLGIFNGIKPASANDSEGSAELLCLVTVDAGPFTPGSPANGINFDAPVAGVLSKAVVETWRGLGTNAAGEGKVATWFRHYDNNFTTGASSNAVRYDGNISTSADSELKLTNVIIVKDVPVIISNYTRTVKQSA